MQTLTSDEVLEAAFQWACKQRKDRSHHHSIWDLRFHWSREKKAIQQQLSSGTYQLGPMKRYCIDGAFVSAFEAKDIVVLKALSLTLAPLFRAQDYPHCTHIKGHGAVHGALRKVSSKLKHYSHIVKSDIYHYYESIQHEVLIAAIQKVVPCPILVDLIIQYMQRVEIRDGIYVHFHQSIPKGCPLSPLIAALYLKPLDDELAKRGFYVRFMDDWVILVKSKSQLRRVVRCIYRVLKKLKLKMHPDKTFIGRIEKGFDFLGIHFGKTVTIATPTVANHRAKLARRYAQNASSIGDYVARWSIWCESVLRCCGTGSSNSMYAPGPLDPGCAPETRQGVTHAKRKRTQS